LPRLALDTNVVVYSEGLEREPANQAKIILSRTLIEAIVVAGLDLIVPAQVLAELHQVLVRRGGLSPTAASVAARRLGGLCTIVPTTAAILDSAFAIVRDHGLPIHSALSPTHDLPRS